MPLAECTGARFHLAMRLLCGAYALTQKRYARWTVSRYPPSHTFVVLAAFGADQLSVPWPIILPSFTVYQVRLGSELTRAKSRLSIFVTR